MTWMIASLAAVESFKHAFASPVPESESGAAFVIWLIVFGIVFSSIAALWLGWIFYQDGKRHGRIARHLGQSLGLSRHEVRILKFMAEHLELPSAACLLISRGCIDAAAERVSISRDQRRQLHQIRSRLFECEDTITSDVSRD